MTAARKKPAAKGIGRLTEEFTSGQLVVGIVVCILIFMCCFLVGILVGKVDPSLHDEAKAGSPRSSDTPGATASRPGRGTTTPRSSSSSSSSAPSDESPYVRPEERTAAPRRTTLRPLPTGEGPETAPAAPHKVAPKPSVPVTSSPSAPEPVITSTAASATKTPTDTKPPAAPEKPTAAAPEKPAPEKPVPVAPETPAKPSTPAVSRDQGGDLKGYGIQLAAFSGATRQADAEAYRRRLHDNAGKDARVLSEGTWCKVVLLGYNDEMEAKAALAELRKTPAFEQAWVRRFP